MLKQSPASIKRKPLNGYEECATGVRKLRHRWNNYGIQDLKRVNKKMSRTVWTIRFLLRCFKHSKRRYTHHFGWHDYAKTPEKVADDLVGFTYDA